MVLNESSPLSSMFVIATPISSMCPTIASVGAPSPARTRANEVPSVSECTSANAEAASRQTRAAGPSWPGRPVGEQQVAQERWDRHATHLRTASARAQLNVSSAPWNDAAPRRQAARSADATCGQPRARNVPFVTTFSDFAIHSTHAARSRRTVAVPDEPHLRREPGAEQVVHGRPAGAGDREGARASRSRRAGGPDPSRRRRAAAPVTQPSSWRPASPPHTDRSCDALSSGRSGGDSRNARYQHARTNRAGCAPQSCLGVFGAPAAWIPSTRLSRTSSRGTRPASNRRRRAAAAVRTAGARAAAPRCTRACTRGRARGRSCRAGTASASGRRRARRPSGSSPASAGPSAEIRPCAKPAEQPGSFVRGR